LYQFTAQFQAVACVVAARARHHRHAAFGFGGGFFGKGYRRPYYLDMFFVVQCGRFAGGAAGHNGVGTVGYLEADKFFISLKV
jgi:hypothetical protein